MTLPLLTIKVGCYGTTISDYYQTMHLSIVKNSFILSKAVQIHDLNRHKLARGLYENCCIGFPPR